MDCRDIGGPMVGSHKDCRGIGEQHIPDNTVILGEHYVAKTSVAPLVGG